MNEQFLSPVETLANLVLVKSPKGTGKTEWLKHIVASARRSWQSVLLIGHRRALITSTAKRIGLTPYMYGAPDLLAGRTHAGLAPVERRFAICLDSLSTRLQPKFDRYDIIILDEVEQVLAHLTASTMRKRRRESLIYLQHYLRNAKKIYVLDADLNRVTGTCIPTIIGPNCVFRRS